MDERKANDAQQCRRREEASIRMEERFDGFLKIYQANESEKQKRLIDLEARLKPLEDLILEARWPVRLAIWIIGLVIAGSLYRFGLYLMIMMRKLIS